MVDSSQFNAEAQNILYQLQQLLNEEDAKIFSALPSLCQQFLSFYRNYYEEGERSSKGLRAHQAKLQNLTNPDQQYSYGDQKETESIRTIVTSLANSARKLESLLTGFKAVFLKTLGQNFVQQIVIESENYTPIIIQLEGFSGMENFIRTSLSDFEGKLKTNKQMLQLINNKNHSNLYSKIYTKTPYVNIYQETRRRLNIFYTKVKKGASGGEGLLLYRPHQHWIKFYVTTLGDVKEGFVSMVSAQAVITHNMEFDIQIFAEQYIGKVDNIAGTLLQDVQNAEKNLQISVKSGSAQTGSHAQLIKIIEKVALGNLEIIREAFTSDQTKAASGSGQRNRIYSNKESKEKIATMINKASGKKAEQATDVTVAGLQNAGNVLVRIQKSI